QSINFLLSKTKTRSVGLRFLIEYLNQCPKNVLEKKANIWLTILIRACNTNEVSLYGELIYEALALLVFQIQIVPEIAKWFGATYLGKLYESFAILEKQIGKTACTVAALKAIQQCLKYYPGPSKSGKPLIVRYLLALVDSSDPEVVYKCGNCWLLLQQVRGSNEGNFNSKTQWQDYQLGLLGSLNALLIDVFRNHKSDYITMDTSNKLEYFTVELQGDPIERVARVCRRFYNLIDFLKIALSQPYPSTKLIRPTKILDFIQNGLGLRDKIDVSNQSMDNVCLRNVLPTLHTKLFELLEVLIDICHTHLRMHFRLITSILLESLNKTKWSSAGFQIEFCNLRMQMHKVTMLWISTLGEGSGCDLIADRLVRDILEDVMILRSTVEKYTSKER
ncbi:GH22375, partial [Drosophila grimshawi]